MDDLSRRRQCDDGGNNLHSIDESRAYELISKERPFPDKARQLLGPKNIEKLQRLLDSDDMIDADLLWMTGGLDPQELTQYLTLQEQFHEMRRAIGDLAQKIVEVLFPKVMGENGYFARCFRRDGVRMKDDRSPLIEFFFFIRKIIQSQVIEVETGTYRNSCLWQLEVDMLQNLMTRIAFEALNNSSHDAKLDVFASIILATNITYEKKYDCSFPGASILRQIGHVEKVLCEGPDAWKKVLQEAGERASDRELDDQYREIFELGMFRRVGKRERRLDHGMKVLTYGDKYFPDLNTRSRMIALARLIVDGTKPYQNPEIRRNAQGLENTHHCLDDGSFECCIDRSTGQLCFINSRVPLSRTPLIGEIRYRGLRALVYNMLETYLRGKREDMRDYWIMTDEERAAMREQEIDGVRTGISSEMEAMGVIDGQQSDGEFHESAPCFSSSEPRGEGRPESHASRESASGTKNGDPQVEAQRSRQRISMRETIPDLVEEEPPSGNGNPEAVHYALHELKGLKTSEVEAAIRHSGGELVSIHGSHKKWKLNERTYPLPMHPKKDVPAGCLKDFLEGLNIPRDAFLPQVHGYKKGKNAPHTKIS